MSGGESDSPTWKRYVAAWNAKTTKAVEKELTSMHRYVQKHSAHYAWHGANVPPGGLADGDKILILTEILRSREVSKAPHRDLSDALACLPPKGGA